MPDHSNRAIAGDSGPRSALRKPNATATGDGLEKHGILDADGDCLEKQIKKLSDRD